ncbi:hypothetical protein OTU49_010394 [Cherax quadricarinatus]|uniref:E2F-associated phosphoprotein n=1 Tax=Cherax quadricarinatus TaxID=27406 RepID=A0AAW0W8G1_CHEQU
MDGSLFGRRNTNYDDYYCDESDDDILCSSKYISSDEDDEKFFTLPMSTKTRKKACIKNQENDDDKDDFEREMASELSQTMRQLATSLRKNKSPDNTSEAAGSSQESKSENAEKEPIDEASKFYDAVYFDSDDSEPEATETSKLSHKTKKKEKRRIMTNDELFYDPTLDDQDQEWVDKMRRSYQPKKQRHEVYHNQYRAMFVFNCNVDMMEKLKFPSKSQKKRDFFKNKRKSKGKQKIEEGAQSSQASSEIPRSEPDSSKMPQTEPDISNMELDIIDIPQVEPDSRDMPQMESNTRDMLQIKSDGSKLLQVEPDSNAATREPHGSRTMDEKEVTCEKNNTVSATTVAAEIKPFSLPHKATFSGNEDEVFHPVTCKICNTKVAVYDKDEVYHFFNIVTSY